MKQIAQGKTQAFRELFSRHGSLVLGYSRRIVKEKALAEDISQEVWMKVVRAAPAYQDKGVFRSWLLRIIRNTALTQLKSLKAENFTFEPGEAVDVSPHDFEQLLNQQHDLQEIKSFIDELPANQRLALVLWLTEDLSYSELAGELETSVQAVKALLFRARQQLLARIRGVS